MSLVRAKRRRVTVLSALSVLTLLAGAVPAAAATPPPHLTPPTAQATATTITIDGNSPGRTFDGVGAISGGGGNSRLLVDYPEPQRSQILDYLFKPGYGAKVQLLKAEIGGDTNSTSGAEPSHQHTADDLNCDRGYEWWIMAQAKARNPNVRLIGLAWGAPGWIGNGQFWSQDMINYVISWLDCAKNSHGLTIDYLGGWNERGFNRDWFVNLKAALATHGYGAVKLIADDSSWTPADLATTDPVFAKAVDVFGNHYMCGYRGPETTCHSTANAQTSGKPLWASENGSDDYNTGADALARGINRGYIDAKLTAYINWPVVAAITPDLPFPRMGLALATQPWSGAFSVGKNAWVMAHTTQFTDPGWRYLDPASGYFGGDRANGSFVTLRSPGADWSTIAETTTATAPQTLTAHITGGLSAAAVHVWATNLHAASSDGYFVRQGDLTPAGGTVTFTAQPGYVYTLSTRTGAGKGTATSPAAHPLALPYVDSYDSYPTGHEAKYLSDMQGAFEVTSCGAGRAGQCVRQMSPRLAILWGPDREPLSLIGDPAWSNYTVSTDVLLEKPGWAQVIGRVAWQRAGGPGGVDAYFLRAGDDGQWSIIRSDTENVFKTLASGTVAALGTNRWHTLALTFSGTTITARIDGTTVGTATDVIWTAGQAGLGTSQGETAQFDNLSVTAAPGPAPSGSGHLENPVSERCLDDSGANQANGNPVLLWTCTGGIHQQWTQYADKSLRIFGTRCLDVLGQSNTPGAAVGIWDCNGGANQQWVLNANGTITSVQSGLCLDVKGGGVANNTAIDVWTCHGGPNQLWRR
ncbi:MAG: xlnA 5 [Actinomycetia bacterium]|nr:xlnA 5 [Actinomycetes bacterium]